MLPTVEIASTPHPHLALRASGSTPHALRYRSRSVSQALRTLANHLPCSLSWTAFGTAGSPLTHFEIAAADFRASLAGNWTASWAVVVQPRIAFHMSRLIPIATARRTPAPVANNPLVVRSLRRSDWANRLHTVCWGRDAHSVLAARRSNFALHSALRLRTRRRLLAFPLALRTRAHCLTSELTAPTIQHAMGLLTSGRALRGLTIQRLLPFTWVRRTEHRAVGLPALHLAPLHPVPGRRGLGAPGLALGDGALGVAVLLADRLSAFPGAMGDAALAFFEGNDGGHGTVGYLQRPHGHRPRGQLHDAHPLHRVVPDAEVYDKV
mmetsp:Transcript_62829/g.168613  ORF Transcript_62829/g.168613 Transcript_62829/m.168613 type:complete len:323 (-) Transcript_62829:5-973(-)